VSPRASHASRGQLPIFRRENIIFGVAYGASILYGIAGVLLSSAGCRPNEALIANINALCNANVCHNPLSDLEELY
jgi:hypothetical protein